MKITATLNELMAGVWHDADQQPLFKSIKVITPTLHRQGGNALYEIVLK